MIIKEKMDTEIIDTGFFYADGGAMFGAIPKTAWRRRYASDEANGCVLAMRSLLVRTDDGRIILIDNGAGDKQLKRLGYYRFFDGVDLNAALAERGICPGDVTDVVLTHLHFDHCGYTTHYGEDGGLRVTFPNARHWVGRTQWENFLHPHPLERDTYFTENMVAVSDAGLLHLIDADRTLCPGVELRLFDGHTPGQIAVYIATADSTLVFAGDVIPLAANVSPAWISAYDPHPVTSYDEKIRMLQEAAEENQTLIFCHDAYTPMARVKKKGEIYLSFTSST